MIFCQEIFSDPVFPFSFDIRQRSRWGQGGNFPFDYLNSVWCLKKFGFISVVCHYCFVIKISKKKNRKFFFNQGKIILKCMSNGLWNSSCLLCCPPFSCVVVSKFVSVCFLFSRSCLISLWFKGLSVPVQGCVFPVY